MEPRPWQDWLAYLRPGDLVVLAAAAGACVGSVLLRWNDSVDSETPERAMRYRVRVGSFPGLADSDHEGASANRGIAVDELARVIDVDRNAREVLDEQYEFLTLGCHVLADLGHHLDQAVG